MYVYVIMLAYNVSFGIVARIIKGNESKSELTYNRYEEPAKWPKLSPIRKISHTHVNQTKEGSRGSNMLISAYKGPQKGEEDRAPRIITV